MTIQKFSLDALQRVRQFIQGGLTIPDLEKQAQATQQDDMPEPESVDDLSGLFSFGGASLAGQSSATVAERWILSTVNPAAPLLKLPGLVLRQDHRLVAYVYRNRSGSVGVVWAIPETLSHTANLTKALAALTDAKTPPKPKGALPHYMEAIEGDRTPVSYLIASMLKRELREFGASGDRRNWSYHKLTDTVPTTEQWAWQAAAPKDLSPKVRLLPDGKAAVEFFSIRNTMPRRLYRHLDQYPTQSYRAQSADKPIAVAQSAVSP
ncbi:MAG: hypothetical protein KME20_00315 [Kaiparowitsia implicata GSE-PSE-MK54-09C]|jgi:hypothetical protein|nr:hypothetical protein [Kaiparowitsia implicata GSE-PSE-MK54-09C]